MHDGHPIAQILPCPGNAHCGRFLNPSNQSREYGADEILTQVVTLYKIKIFVSIAR